MPRGKNYVNNNRGVTLQSGTSGPVGEQCFYGNACNRTDCIYRHDGPQQQHQKSKDPCMAYLAGLCTFEAKTCRKTHPSDAEAARLVAKYSAIKCRFYDKCKTKGCLYIHGSSNSANDAGKQKNRGNRQALSLPSAFPPLPGAKEVVPPGSRAPPAQQCIPVPSQTLSSSPVQTAPAVASAAATTTAPTANVKPTKSAWGPVKPPPAVETPAAATVAATSPQNTNLSKPKAAAPPVNAWSQQRRPAAAVVASATTTTSTAAAAAPPPKSKPPSYAAAIRPVSQPTTTMTTQRMMVPPPQQAQYQQQRQPQQPNPPPLQQQFHPPQQQQHQYPPQQYPQQQYPHYAEPVFHPQDIPPPSQYQNQHESLNINAKEFVPGML